MPDKDLQAIVLKQLQNDKVAVTSVDQITKQMLEDHLTIIYTAVNPSSQMNSKDIFQHLLNVQSLTGLQYAKNLTSVSFHSYLGAFEQHDLPFRNGYLSDISSLGLLTKMNSVDIQRNNVHDISAVSNMQLGSGSGFSWNSITDVSPLQKSKDTIGSGISLTAMIYMLPSITLNASVSSYTMSSFIIKNIDGANVPITPYYYDTYQQSLSTAFAKKYISTAEGGASNEPVQEVKWTDLAKAGNSGYLTTYWRDTLFGLPTSPYEGVVVQPYTLDPNVGNLTVRFIQKNVDGDSEKDLYPQQTLSGADGASFNLKTNTDIQNIIQYLEQKYGFTGYTVDGNESGNYSKTATPTVKYIFNKEPAAAQPVTVNYVDAANGNSIATSKQFTGKIGDSYDVGLTSSYKLDVSGYTFKDIKTGSDPVTGKLDNTPKTVTYEYTKNSTPVNPVNPINPVNPVNPVTPVSPTPTPTPTPSTPTVTTQPSTPGIAKKGEAVYALKKIYMYSNKDFKQSEQVASYAKKPRINRPMFVVTDYAKSKAGNLRYVVRDVNHHSKTAGKKGYITADYAFVRPVYYHSSHKTLTVINPRGVNEYKNKNLTGKVKNFKQGTQLKVKGFVKHNLTTRYLLSNGHYITGNRKLVIAGNQKQPKQIKVKKAIYRYNNANFGKHNKLIKKGTVLKVKKWEYSHPYSTTTFGAKRYAVAGGYVTANSKYVKVIK